MGYMPDTIKKHLPLDDEEIHRYGTDRVWILFQVATHIRQRGLIWTREDFIPPVVHHLSIMDMLLEEEPNKELICFSLTRLEMNKPKHPIPDPFEGDL